MIDGCTPPPPDHSSLICADTDEAPAASLNNYQFMGVRDHRKVFCRAPGAWFLCCPSSPGGPGLPGASGLILIHLSREQGMQRPCSYSSYTEFEDVIPLRLLIGRCCCDFYSHSVTKAYLAFFFLNHFLLCSIYIFNYIAFSIGSFIVCVHIVVVWMVPWK